MLKVWRDGLLRDLVVTATFTEGSVVQKFFQLLETQRWDDHRYYHQSRINQSLHFISAVSFLFAYGLLFIDPPMAALVGWLISMTTRQSGHFFFEPLGFDTVNNVSNEYKEEIKVGYNLQRKVILIGTWALTPLLVYLSPTLFGTLPAYQGFNGFMHHVGWIWLFLGAGGLIFRTVHLFFLKDVMNGLAWMTKILTDPFHDIGLYYKAPYYLLRGQLLDPMDHVVHAGQRG